MRRYKTSFLTIFCALAFAAPRALAADTPAPAEPLKPLHVEMRYDGNYGLLALGRVRVTIEENPADYRIHLDTKSRGLASWFSDLRSVAEARGIIRDGRAIPQHYQSDEDRKNTNGLHQHIEYDAKGAITQRERVPQDDPNWRPIVPIAQANSAVDPISAYLLLRPKLQEMLDKNSTDTDVRTYDGARLAEMRFHLVRHATLEIMGAPMQVIDTTIRRDIISGYTPKERKKFLEGDPEIHIYFSDDARLLPVMITVDLGLGQLTIELAELSEK